MGCEKRLEFKQDRGSPFHYHTLGQINSCQWDITLGILVDEKDLANTVNIQPQVVQNIKSNPIQIKQNILWQIFTASKWQNCNTAKYISRSQVAVTANPETDLTNIEIVWKYKKIMLTKFWHQYKAYMCTAFASWALVSSWLLTKASTGQ